MPPPGARPNRGGADPRRPGHRRRCRRGARGPRARILPWGAVAPRGGPRRCRDDAVPRPRGAGDRAAGRRALAGGGRVMVGVAPFRNHLPVKVRFGEGVASELADVHIDEGISRAFVILDEGLEALLAPVGDALAAAAARGIELIRFTRAAGEPALP